MRWLEKVGVFVGTQDGVITYMVSILINTPAMLKRCMIWEVLKSSKEGG